MSNRSTLIFGLVCGCLLQSGCAQFHKLNPWTRAEWAADEALGPTFHQRVGELKGIRSKASSYSASDRAHLIGQLASLYKQDEDPLIREEAVRTIGVLGEASGNLGVVAEAVGDDELNVRIAACRACSKIGGAQASQRLAYVLGADADADVRLEAARQLANFKDKTAIDALGNVLAENDPALQYRAVQSLKQNTGKDFGDNASAWSEYIAGGNPQVEQPSVASRLRNWFN